MKHLAAVIGMIALLAGLARAQEPAGMPAAKTIAPDAADLAASAPPASSAAMLDDPLIRDAVSATLKEEEASTSTFGHDHSSPYAHNPAIDTPKLNRYETFAIAFDQAKLPDCLHADGLKYQPKVPLIPAQFLLPLIVVAKLRGVCI